MLLCVLTCFLYLHLDKIHNNKIQEKLLYHQKANEELSKTNEKLLRNYEEINNILKVEQHASKLYKDELNRYK